MIQHWFIHCVRCHLYAWMIHRSVLSGLRKKNKTKNPKKKPQQDKHSLENGIALTENEWKSRQHTERYSLTAQLWDELEIQWWFWLYCHSIWPHKYFWSSTGEHSCTQIPKSCNEPTKTSGGWSNGICNWDCMFTPTSMQTTVATLFLLVLSF